MLLDVVAVSLAAASGVCGIVGAGRASVRVWLVHLTSVAAMIWMVLPSAVAMVIGRQAWVGVLLALLLWTAVSHAASGSGSLDGPSAGSRIVAAREIADLAATSALVLILAASHGTASTPVPGAHGHGDGPALAASVPVVVLIGWAGVVVACAIAAHRGVPNRRRATVGSSGALLMVLGMSLMAGMNVAA